MDHSKSTFVHNSSFIDDNVKIGENSKIWHFSHIQSGGTYRSKIQQLGKM